jgi:hypothetical protein
VPDAWANENGMNNPVGCRSCRFRFCSGEIGGGVGYFIVYNRWVEGITYWYVIYNILGLGVGLNIFMVCDLD